MSHIALLDQSTINKIAAGEVVERPAAVVKELVENAIDAGANAVTVEIKEGGISFIRITDNGIGIDKNEIPLAFKRHSTSKIRTAEDLVSVSSLGFRGEALASIAAVSQVELVTKTSGALIGSRYVIEGGKEKGSEDIGCPEGTTFLMRNLFYNTPARRKFLKSAMTEASYVADLVERMAISHPTISFKFLNNNQLKLHTSGNGQIKEVIYHIYGREIANQQLSVSYEGSFLKISGFIGKPLISRGNRNYMNYFINGRYIKSSVINKAIEEAYKPYTMSHRYPFTCLLLEIESERLDVNVHPTKMEVRFTNQEELFRILFDVLTEALKERELIPEVSFEQTHDTKKIKPKQYESKHNIPEPFERNRREEEKRVEHLYKAENSPNKSGSLDSANYLTKETNTLYQMGIEPPYTDNVKQKNINTQQIHLFEDKLLSKEAIAGHRIIGQLFSTYWIVEYQDKMYIIDQHAAHEKVLYERTMKLLEERQFSSQMVEPPIILSLSMREEEVLKENIELFKKLGFEIEGFGGKEYSVRAVPNDLFNIAKKELLVELIDNLSNEDRKQKPDILVEKIASMSCKAAVKGHQNLSYTEAKELINELLSLENPYHCPHGRPTIISMSKYEIEKKFKRIV